jgi:site-specific DNA-methyltransferase (adenine-specific)
MNEVHYSSKNKEWETPNSLYKPLEKEFNIMLDVCATEENKKCALYFNKKLNGLTSDWRIVGEFGKLGKVACWMNPPYGREIGAWVKKADKEKRRGVTTVALLPARTDTKWFHDYIYNKAEIRFLKGRIRFVDAKASAPFPSMIVIFKPEKKRLFRWKK